MKGQHTVIHSLLGKQSTLALVGAMETGAVSKLDVPLQEDRCPVIYGGRNSETVYQWEQLALCELWGN